MTLQPNGHLPGKSMHSLVIVVFLLTSFFPVSATVIHTAAQKSSLTLPWTKILNRGVSTLHPFGVPGRNPLGHALAAKWSSPDPLARVYPPYLSTQQSPPATVTKDFVNSLAPLSAWRETAAMAHGRTGHSATLLPDGRVLIAGGWEEFDTLPLASAEIYNPAANTWTGAGTMAIARGAHTATLLPNGRVLVTGGVNWQDSIYSSAELYDPVTNSWSSAGNMSTSRCGHTATQLSDGRTLVAGGYYDISSPESTNNIDLYDPATNTWSAIDTMTEGRAEHTASLLSNGKVMVAGGYNNSTGRLSSAELYDPDSDTWSAVNDMAYGSYDHTATVLPDGKVLIVGGQGNEITALGRTELFDPDTGSWTGAAPLHANRMVHTATLLPDGRLLVTGGYDGGSELTSAELYDPASNTWSESGVFSVGRGGHTASLLPDGRVFIVGGDGASFPTSALSSTEIFQPADDSWNTTGELAQDRVAHTATLLTDGKVLVAGGWNESGLVDTGEVYDPVVKTWTNAGAMERGRSGHSSTLLPDGRVLVAGGSGEIVGTVLDSSELFNSTSGTWSVAANLGTARANHSASLLPNGKILVAGGRGATDNSLASAELYDLSANTWENAAPMTIARDLHTAILLPDGRVLVAGGYDKSSNTSLSSAELYDPLTNSWSNAGQMTTPRDQFSSFLLPDGRVFVAGGYSNNGTVLNNAELYNPATNTWTAAATMSDARGGAAATSLPDGRVLVAGGWNGTTVLSNAEAYDPATNTWSAADNLVAARAFSAATLLPDGQVLVTGGMDATGYSTPSAELFDAGLGYDDAWRPAVASVPEPLYLYLPFSLTGSGFRGFGNSEAASGGTSSSATNVPLVQLRSDLNGQVQWLKPEEFSAASYTGKPISDFPPGPAWLTVFVNGIPSVAEYVLVALPYTATAAVGENGRIDASTPSPAGVIPGSNGTVRFTFTANDHHHIAAITGCGIDYTNTDNGVTSLTVTTAPITGDCTVDALFAINQYTVSAQAGANGSLDNATPSPQTIDYGTTTQFTFQAAAGHHITSISGCGISYLNSDQAVTSRTETTDAITGDCTVSAAFAVNSYTLHVDITGKGTGTVSSSPVGISCPGDCEESLEYEEMVTLTAAPARGSSFQGWAGDCTGKESTCSVPMNSAKNVQARFHAFPWPMFLPAITRTPLP